MPDDQPAPAAPPEGPDTPEAAFTELGAITLADHSLASVLQRVADLVVQVVPGADAASVTFVERDEAHTVAFAGELAKDLDERQYERGHGPCLDGIEAGVVVSIDDMASETRWPDYTPVALERGAGSSLTVPLPLQREVGAALNLYATDARAFGPRSLDLATTFSAYAGVALANVHLYESQSRVAYQLQAAMQSRAVIDQARGILMGTRRCTPQEAFDILVDLSQRSNRKLREVAQALVDAAVTAD